MDIAGGPAAGDPAADHPSAVDPNAGPENRIGARPPHTRMWRAGRLEDEGFPVAEVHERLAWPGTLLWLDLCAPDTGDLRAISNELGIDPHAVEDAVSRHERAKLDRYDDDNLFLNAYSVRLDVPSGELSTYEISAFITARALITVHADRDFDVRTLISLWDDTADLAAYGISYLLHGLLDLIVDGHFDAVQSLDDEIDGLEELLFGESVGDRDMQRRSYRLRKSLALLRRVVLPMREVVNTLLRRDLHIVPAEMGPYFQDVYDHVLRATEWTDSQRDIVTSLQETRIALQGNRLNEVMKRLTGWAAIIAVPTLITGFYGMNVPYPGFSTRAGFAASIAILLGSAIVLYVIFKKRDWL